MGAVLGAGRLVRSRGNGRPRARARLARTGLLAVLLATGCGGGELGAAPVPLPVTPREVSAAQLHPPVAPAPATCRGHVALTFDDGPSPLTGQLLAALRHYDVPATFFNVGAKVEQFPWQVERTLRAGHQLGNHTMTHAELPTLDRTQVEQEIDGVSAVHRRLGLPPTAPLFRPPYGATSPQVRALAASRGLTEALWDKDSKDWQATTVDAIVQRSKGMGDGDILLLHDGKPLTVSALPRVIGSYHEQGLCFGRVAVTATDRPTSDFDTAHNAVAVSR